jgi:hypothetical protein
MLDEEFRRLVELELKARGNERQRRFTGLIYAAMRAN